MLTTAAVQAAATALDPLAVSALIVSVFALAAAVASAIYSRRQARAAEETNRAVEQANRLDTSARLRVIVRDRRETTSEGMLGETTTRWEIENVGRVAARRVELTVTVPGHPSTHLSPWKADVLEPGQKEIIDMRTPYVPSLSEVTRVKAERGPDSVYADAEWRDERDGIQRKRIEIEFLDVVHPTRAEGDYKPH